MLKSILSHHNRIDGSHSQNENPQSSLMIKTSKTQKGPFFYFPLRITPEY